MPKAPSRYSPLINKHLALKRRNIVLKQMQDTGIITGSDFDEALKQELVLGKQKKKQESTGYFIEYIKGFLEEKIGSSRLYKDGLTVHTTLSLKLQNAADNAIAGGMNALETRMKKNGIKEPYPQGALIALDVSTGGILAMTGGRDFNKSPFNRAVYAERQPGSAFKPFVYAYAIKQGFSQNRMILDAPVVFKGAENKKDWMPENFSRKYMGEITLRKALTASKNIPAVRLMEMLGPDSVARFSNEMGIEAPLSHDLSLALGTSEITLIDLTSAYAVFPNMGERIAPFGVIDVIDRSGRVLWKVKPEKSIVMSRTDAAIMTDMLSGVIKEGTGMKARVIEHPVAGKTGTTNHYRDALFIGFSPAVAAGVWVGRDEYKTLGNLETGARAALPIWIEFITKALADRPYQYFDIPDDVVRLCINPLTGYLAASDSKHAVTAIFKKGTEPLE
jgi:penicillin-binding protein 1A